MGIGPEPGIVLKPKDSRGVGSGFGVGLSSVRLPLLCRCRRWSKDNGRSLASSPGWSQLAACRFLMHRMDREQGKNSIECSAVRLMIQALRKCH
ncbi:MAG: hypothetical protein OXC57_12265 [Rhodobacteraceae bacterium]|nr:hypothetical protein [Paracoccaceae bacterium]